MFNKDKDTITYTYNMSFICSVCLICSLIHPAMIYVSYKYDDK